MKYWYYYNILDMHERFLRECIQISTIKSIFQLIMWDVVILLALSPSTMESSNGHEGL